MVSNLHVYIFQVVSSYEIIRLKFWYAFLVPLMRFTSLSMLSLYNIRWSLQVMKFNVYRMYLRQQSKTVLTVIKIQSVSKEVLQLWKFMYIYSKDMHSVLSCHNVA
jgi:hypothetical protein